MERELSPPARSWTPLLRNTVVILALAGLVLLARSVSVERPLAWLSAEVHRLGFWGPLAFGGLFVVVTLLLLPSTPVTLAAGAVFGTVVGAVTMSLASLVSATLSFFFSRYVAHDRVARMIHRYPKLEALWRALGEDEGWKIVAAVRLSHALPFGVQNLLFGVSPIRFVPFLVTTGVAMVPGTLLYAYLGSLGAEALGADGAPPTAGGWALRLGGLVVIAAAVLYIVHFARRIIRAKTAVDLAAAPLTPVRTPPTPPDL